MSNNIKFSLVIPCFNESGNLTALVERCRVLLASRPNVEVVLVENGSTDNSEAKLYELFENDCNDRLRFVKVDVNQGYGHGILFGLQNCKGGVMGWTHADLQADPLDFAHAISFFASLDTKSNVFVKGERYGRSFLDRCFTRAMTIVEWLILGVKMTEINAQPTLFSRSFYETWQSPPNDFSLDLYVYRQALYEKLKIIRFPVYFGLRLIGEGHNDAFLSKLRYSWKTIQFSLNLRSRLRGIKD
jgi:polyisoprenyl-phosphate glycosyltransferase